MVLLKKQELVCLDCEATGLNIGSDRVIEFAAVKFSVERGIIDSYETLINPEMDIPEESFKIHNISDEMVSGKSIVKEVLPIISKFVGNGIIVGHNINFDIDLISAEADRVGVDCKIKFNQTIDTLRLARIYGDSPINSLEFLRKHFNIEEEGAHRAMNDVKVNIQVFKYLSDKYAETNQILTTLSKPVLMRKMPLGKHKGRLFKDIPVNYLSWAAHQKFDQDLLYSLRKELKVRKKGSSFNQINNPFANL